MANGKFKDQINKSCSSGNWDQGNDTHAPTDQAMGGGVSTVKQKCNAATNESQEDDDMSETYSDARSTGAQVDAVTSAWKDSTFGGNSTPSDAGGFDRNGSQTMQGGGPEYTENHDGPFYGGVDDQYTGVRDVRTGGTGASSSQGPASPTMGFTGDPTENGTVNSDGRNTVRNLKNQTTATHEETTPVNRASDREVRDADEAQIEAENAANDARAKAENIANMAQAKAENAANTAQAKAENAGNTVQKKGGGVMDTLKNRAEEFFNTDFDNDGTVGERAETTYDTAYDLQDPDVEHGTRSAMNQSADKRIPTAVGF